MLVVVAGFPKLQGVDVKVSIYNKIVPYNSDYLVYNQVTGALLRVGKNSIHKVKSVFDNDFSNTSLVAKLSSLGFLVDDEDERDRMRKVYERKSTSHINKHLFVTVTDQCNLGCHYCFEEKNQWIKMSPETQESLKDFSRRFLTETETKYFGVGWYGGEPTIHMPAIENLSEFYTSFCKDNQIDFHQMMITNGTTFTDKVCEKLIRLGIRKVQITVDGFKEDHDVSRPYLTDLAYEDMNEAQKRQISKIRPISLPILGQQQKQSPRSSYDEILNGIVRYVAKGGEVSLRMNVNEHTILRVTNLLDDLLGRGLFTKNENGGFVYAYAHPIYDGGGCGSDDGGNCGSCKISTMKMESFAKRLDMIKDWYKRNEVKYYDHSTEMKFTGETCTANKKYEYVINPDGTICKCTHDVGKPDRVIGDVSMSPDPNSMTMGLSKFDQFNPFDDAECFGCEVLPICMGGCKSNNKVGESKSYDAGCISTRYSLENDIIRLYEKSKSTDEMIYVRHSH